MRRHDENGRAMEANQTERAQAVVSDDGGVRYVVALGGERMEVRGTNRLDKQQNGGHKASYPAHPTSTLYLER
jgi:hypothetical protein